MKFSQSFFLLFFTATPISLPVEAGDTVNVVGSSESGVRGGIGSSQQDRSLQDNDGRGLIFKALFDLIFKTEIVAGKKQKIDPTEPPTAVTDMEPQLLSIYLGIIDNNALPTQVWATTTLECNADRFPTGVIMDGMPVTFNVPVSSVGLAPEMFEITTESDNGPTITTSPDCASLQPSGESDELLTILLFSGDTAGGGKFAGTINGNDGYLPTKVKISAFNGNDLISTSGDVLSGIETTDIIYGFDCGLTLLLAYRYPMLNGAYQIQTVWTGGLTMEGNGNPDATMAPNVTLVAANGTEYNPVDFDDIGDQDNFLSVNLPPGLNSADVVEIKFAPYTAFDPRNFGNCIEQTSIVSDPPDGQVPPELVPSDVPTTVP